MALPKIELPHGRFNLRGMLREVEKRLGELFRPLDLSAKKEKKQYTGSPGVAEWEEGVPEERIAETKLESAVRTKKRLPGKGPRMESKKMHKPKRDARRGEERGARGRLQKRL
ncbi:hypothetical protein GF412_03830 [Candidatus Micrarchaeota archaeon]|nr:hypothetical protein [Candidatus Micrarchaeota archaeon]MBD3418080.1 hypothetical protein [Candidatus Micrarchaeota archaeon]